MVLHQHTHGHGHSHGHNHQSHKRKCEENISINIDDDDEKESLLEKERKAEEGGGKKTNRKRRGIDFRNINVRAAFIHTIGDLVQSIGVIIAGYIIWFKVCQQVYCVCCVLIIFFLQPEWYFADPICTFLFSILVIISTLTVLRDALLVLMEGQMLLSSSNLPLPPPLSHLLPLLHVTTMYFLSQHFLQVLPDMLTMRQ